MRATKREYTQEPHCCLMESEGDPLLRAELRDGGGGEFLVLSAHQWALDSDDEIDMLANELKAMLEEARK